MHPNKTFRVTDRAKLFEFVRQKSFGQIVALSDNGLRAASVPFLLDEEGPQLRFHLSRGNALVAALSKGTEAFVSLLGADTYISPDWYGIPDQVPTWNYVAVHIRGRCEQLPTSELPRILDDLSAQHEARLAPKTPWTRSKMTPERDEGLQRGIVPFALSIEHIEGTWKLGQNKPDAAILSTIKALNAQGAAMPQEIAALMQDAYDSDG